MRTLRDAVYGLAVEMPSDCLSSLKSAVHSMWKK